MDGAAEIAYRKAPGHGTYEVVMGGTIIGTIRRFAMGAGQFGERWQATTPDGQQGAPVRTRRAAAGWLRDRAAEASRRQGTGGGVGSDDG